MALPVLALLLCMSAASTSGEGQPFVPTREVHLFSTVPPAGKSCAPTSDIPTAGLNLTAEERDMLQYICWQPEGGQLGLGERRGIPPGVTCTAKEWCDGDVCSTVCAAGTVAVEPWLHNAVKLQARLARALPFCFATLLGTHNSAITLANGYGNLDPYFQQFFKYIKWAVSDFSDALLRTNDQWLSLTDQLNLGVRGLEVDTHWVGGALRVAHCGGVHIEPLNQIIRAINLVAKLLHHNIRWDTETLGCMPSLSSIPAMEQRLMVEGLAEVKAWLDAPGNEDEFVLVYFDDQPDLMAFEVEEQLQADVRSVFSPEEIFSVDDLTTYQSTHGAGAWPAAAEMVAAGKRVLFVSGADYGQAMLPLIFSRWSATVCGWTEPGLANVEGLPQCVVDSQDGPTRQRSPTRQPLFSGTLIRVVTCELEYGPLNCDFVFRGSNEPYLDEATMPAVLGCGLNMPSPDLLTPSKAAAAIWTWAPGHPYEPTPGGGVGAAAEATVRAMRRAAGKGAAAGGEQAGLALEEEEANCAVISASDSRWRAVPCNQALPTACRVAATNSTPPAADDPAALAASSGGQAILTASGLRSRRLVAATVAAAAAGASHGSARNGGLPSLQWVLSAAGGARGACAQGSAWDVPRHPSDNYHLANLLRETGAAAAWLPISGPGWEVPATGSSGAAATA